MRAGMTLMEVLVAISITAVLGAIIVSLINSAAMGTADQQDGRRHLVRIEAIRTAVEAEARATRSFLAAGPNGNALVYWVGDTMDPYIAPNNAVNLSELGMLELDTASGQLRLYRTAFPAGWSSSDEISADVQYAAITDWYQAAQSAKTTGYFNATVLAHNVTGMSVTMDSASPTRARMAYVTVTLNDGQVTRTAVFGLGLRNQAAPN